MVRAGLREGSYSHAKWTRFCTTFQAFCGLGAARNAVWTALFAVFWHCMETAWKYRQAIQHSLKDETLEAEQVFSRRVSFNWTNFLIIWQAVWARDCFICPQKSECLCLLRSIHTSKGRVTFVKIRTVNLLTEDCSLRKVLEASLFCFLLFFYSFFFFFLDWLKVFQDF